MSLASLWKMTAGVREGGGDGQEKDAPATSFSHPVLGKSHGGHLPLVRSDRVEGGGEGERAAAWHYSVPLSPVKPCASRGW